MRGGRHKRHVTAALLGVLPPARLTAKSGVLVWHIAAARYFTGMQSVSQRGLALLTLALVGYALLRFSYSGIPTGILQATGAGSRTCDAHELTTMLGSRGWLSTRTTWPPLSSRYCFQSRGPASGSSWHTLRT